MTDAERAAMGRWNRIRSGEIYGAVYGEDRFTTADDRTILADYAVRLHDETPITEDEAGSALFETDAISNADANGVVYVSIDGSVVRTRGQLAMLLEFLGDK